jgi:flagellar protein FliO/FliZ
MSPMTQTLISVGIFVVLLALVPVGLRWVQRRAAGGGAAMTSTSRIISAIAVGPHQRVVTVEVGPEGGRTWLTLGVTAQTITCLHSAAVESKMNSGSAQAIQSAPVQS